MAVLTQKQRDDMPDSGYALPDKRMFPLPNADHAHAALFDVPAALSAGSITSAEAAMVRAKAKAKLSGGDAPAMPQSAPAMPAQPPMAGEGSMPDMKADAAGMKRTGMNSKEWESSAADAKQDAHGNSMEMKPDRTPHPVDPTRDVHGRALSLAAMKGKAAPRFVSKMSPDFGVAHVAPLTTD